MLSSFLSFQNLKDSLSSVLYDVSNKFDTILLILIRTINCHTIMHKMKIKVLIFARSFLANYASEIDSDIFDTIFVVLTKKEKELIEAKGKKVYGCFEYILFSATLSSYKLKTTLILKFKNTYC